MSWELSQSGPEMKLVLGLWIEPRLLLLSSLKDTNILFCCSETFSFLSFDSKSVLHLFSASFTFFLSLLKTRNLEYVVPSASHLSAITNWVG